MRLLEISKQGKVSLTRPLIDKIDEIPPYAILSHTWGEDNEEVTFQDLTQCVGKSKVGYEKIRFCRKQAARDGLQHVWIDTCCIDKTNSTELSEALNSMFRWYSKATKCYVYLSDVSAQSGWKSAFRKSRWFTRGWTLQELLAPRSVDFFSGEGERLGDRNSLGQQVREITGIPIDALQGKDLSSFSVPMRMSWAENRETKREEDKAYSLMGIFGIHMSPIYGEGEAEAFQRLRSKIDKRDKLPQVLQDKERVDASTVFDLFPDPDCEVAVNIVRNNINHSKRFQQDPDDPSKIFLTFGFHLRSKTPGLLAKFGRCTLTNDVILGKGWSKMDQCYFDVHPGTGEVLLHDLSTRHNTQLYSEDGVPQMKKSRGQCVVPMNREWVFKIGHAKFLLKPRKAQDLEAFKKERLSFINQPVPEEYEGTYEGALQQMSAFDLESVGSCVYNTRMNTPFQPELGNEIRYQIIKWLGQGSQGEVYEVVDMDTGDHWACKKIRTKLMPKLGITTEKAFKRKIEAAVSLLSNLRHDHILPIVCSQGWLSEQTVNIFYPLCEEDFDIQIANFKSKEERKTTTMTMLKQISQALDYIHTQNPIILHRDIKPSNIMYRGKYELSDFDIAKTVDSSPTLVGTNFFMAPELRQGRAQDPSLDIYSLGVTATKAMFGFPLITDLASWSWQQWHFDLQDLVRGTIFESMLASNPEERPTALGIQHNFSFSLPPRIWIGSRESSSKTPGLTPPRDVVSRRHKQPDIERTELVKSTKQERKKGQKFNVSSGKERRARSQSLAVPNQTLVNRRRRSRSRSKSIRAKLREMRDGGEGTVATSHDW